MKTLKEGLPMRYYNSKMESEWECYDINSISGKLGTNLLLRYETLQLEVKLGNISNQ